MRPSPAGKKLAALSVAIVFATLASWAYRSFYFSPFEPIRIGVVDAEQVASRHVVPIPLPDVSSLRGQRAVLALRLRNGGPEPKRIALLREGFQNNRIVLPADDEIDWNILVSPELMQVLGAASGAARALELTSDADVWSVMSGDIRNYRWHVGGPFSAAIVPTSTGGLRLWLSTPAFFILAAVLFAPIGWYGAPTVMRLPQTMRRWPAIAAQTWKRHALTFQRGAALLGLVAIAVAQPVFEVVSNSPEFFPARGTNPGTLVGTVAFICLGIPLGLLAIERALQAIAPRAATTFHGAALTILMAAVVMPWFRRSGAVGFPWDAIASGVIGIGVAIAYSRTRGVRQFLTALAPAAIVVPALFLLSANVQRYFQPPESGAAVQAVQRTPPIVLVIFDEFPTNSLLTPDGTIDAGRFPNFGALAHSAYWFRNASTVAYNTSDAVPAILSGRYVPSDKAIPTLRHWPVNVFTALAPYYRIFASIRFQRLCPPSACEQNAAIAKDGVPLLLSDLSLVWLHIVLPEPLTAELPPVVGEWAEFGRAPAPAKPGIRRGREGWWAEFLAPMDRQPGRMHVIHLVLPHMPFEHVPSGRRYSAPDFQGFQIEGSFLFEKASAALADTLHQRHLAQVGYADRLIGDLLARLRSTGVYDDALVIITADHGASYREGRRRREPRPAQQNLSDILQVPLFVKLPAQHQGEVVDRIVETVDIFPTILDVVGAKVSSHVDGRSLIDGTAGRNSFILRTRNNTRPRRIGDLAADRASSLERKERRFGHGDFQGLYAPPSARHLLGTELTRASLTPAADVQLTLSQPAQWESVALDTDPLPIYVTGAVTSSRADPLNVVVAVNGTIRAIARSYKARGGHTFATLVPETALKEGRNTVTAFVVDGLPVTDP